MCAARVETGLGVNLYVFANDPPLNLVLLCESEKVVEAVNNGAVVEGETLTVGEYRSFRTTKGLTVTVFAMTETAAQIAKQRDSQPLTNF